MSFNGFALYVRESGSGYPLLMINGLGGNLEMWGATQRRLRLRAHDHLRRSGHGSLEGHAAAAAAARGQLDALRAARRARLRASRRRRLLARRGDGPAARPFGPRSRPAARPRRDELRLGSAPPELVPLA